jgi:hypothetical protein
MIALLMGGGECPPPAPGGKSERGATNGTAPTTAFEFQTPEQSRAVSVASDKPSSRFLQGRELRGRQWKRANYAAFHAVHFTTNIASFQDLCLRTFRQRCETSFETAVALFAGANSANIIIG